MDIKITGLSKSFGENHVLKDLNLTFPGKEITCIMGPSGCGKTTLLNILMGLTRPDKGIVEGIPKSKSAVFQEDRLCQSFNAVSNVRLVCDKRVDDAKIISHLERVGLKDSCKKPVRELSGGMKRRVAIVRAILAPSEILFLDEPFKGLDDETKKATMEYVKENIVGKTVIMVTHNIEEVRALKGSLLLLE
jgi:NitT/TauT family transport system ATP-binding protein